MNAACRATLAAPDPQSDRPMADGLSSQEGRPQPARRAGRAKPSPSAPSLKPLACRPEGGKSLPRLLFSAFFKSRASDARQARRAAPCGQGLRRCGHVVKALPCPHVHAGGALVHQADTGARVVLPRVGGLGGGKHCNQGAECRRESTGAAPRGQPHGRAGVAGHHGGHGPHTPTPQRLRARRWINGAPRALRGALPCRLQGCQERCPSYPLPAPTSAHPHATTTPALSPWRQRRRVLNQGRRLWI